MERAYFDARTHGWSKAPIVEVLLPSVVDDSLGAARDARREPLLPARAPRTWAKWCQDERGDDARDEVADLMIDTVDRVAPNFRASVVGRRALTPLDLEREFGLIGGDIFHGALALDQLFSARPVLGHGNYRSPIRGLYMCGSGTHPGGGVTGAPGHNAAREILKGRAAAALRHRVRASGRRPYRAP
jgi:phytoene dehydrogenase-like protein